MKSSNNIISGFGDFLLLGGSSLIILPLMYYLFPPGVHVSSNVAYQVLQISLFLDYLVNFPHFSSSYQIFYSNFSNKIGTRGLLNLNKSYLFAGVIVPFLLVALIAVASYSQNFLIISSIVTLRLMTFGWHYSKQGYGIFILLGRIRNFILSDFEKSILLFNTHLAWICAWIQFNSEERNGRYFGVAFSTFKFSDLVLNISQYLMFAMFIFTACVFIYKYIKSKQIPPLNAILAYIASAYLWIGFRYGLGEGRGIEIAFLFSPFFHSLQYFSVVQKTKFIEVKNKTINLKEFSIFFIKSVVLGALLFSVFPIFLNKVFFSSIENISVQYFTFCFWSFINIHHFFIDNVSWRNNSQPIKLLINYSK